MSLAVGTGDACCDHLLCEWVLAALHRAGGRGRELEGVWGWKWRGDGDLGRGASSTGSARSWLLCRSGSRSLSLRLSLLGSSVLDHEAWYRRGRVAGYVAVGAGATGGASVVGVQTR